LRVETVLKVTLLLQQGGDLDVVVFNLHHLSLNLLIQFFHHFQLLIYLPISLLNDDFFLSNGATML